MGREGWGGWDGDYGVLKDYRRNPSLVSYVSTTFSSVLFGEIRSQSVIGCLQKVGVLNKISTAENVIYQVKDECSYILVTTMGSDNEKC